MTNILGMALIVLSVNTNTVYETNSVNQTCEQAGCTNTAEYVVSVEVEAPHICYYHQRFQPLGSTNELCECTIGEYREETRVGCLFWHSKKVVEPVVVQKEIVVGTKGVPLFVIFEQKHVPSYKKASKRFTIFSSTFYTEGTWITSTKERK